MKFLILNTDYADFLRWLYARRPGLGKMPYAEQIRERNESLFGVADFYSANLRKLGHEAYDIHVNNEFMQKAWARERGVRTDFRSRWYYSILASQLKIYKPDAVLNMAMDGVESKFLKEMKRHMKLLVGQIAAPLPQGEDFACYDLVVSSLPNLVEHFRKLGIRSELNRLAFEPKALEGFKSTDKDTIPVSFVGSLSLSHQSRIKWLEYLCKKLDIKLWGTGVKSLSGDSPIRRSYMGEAWGIEMYRIFQRSKITLNHHIDLSDRYANNMRLYEATGAGALLITDWKEDLFEIFEPGKEVVAYHSPEECEELVKYYLERGKERETIASAGQRRTLQTHTYYKRMEELLDIIQGLI